MCLVYFFLVHEITVLLKFNSACLSTKIVHFKGDWVYVLEIYYCRKLKWQIPINTIIKMTKKVHSKIQLCSQKQKKNYKNDDLGAKCSYGK